MFTLDNKTYTEATELFAATNKKVGPTHREKVMSAMLLNQVKDGNTVKWGSIGAFTAAAKSMSATEAAPSNNASGGSGKMDYWDPVLISLVRRTAPRLIAYDVCGVQPMMGPDGSIFAMRSRFTDQDGPEALFNETDTAFAGLLPSDTPAGTAHAGSDPLAPAYSTGHALPRQTGEARGSTGEPAIPQMAFTIEKTTVTAKTRILQAQLTDELQQDLQNIHGISAREELANILSNELLFEINRELVRTIYTVARLGSQKNVTTGGVFDLITDTTGRWSAERFKGLHFQIERDANQIYKETRRGKGNFVIVSADVASALQMAGILDYAPALESNVNVEVDEAVSTFAGTISGGRMKVFIDPYFSSANFDFFCVGYRGPNPIDAGLYYCPYIPFQKIELRGQDNFQPRMAFRTRYGIVSNPFVTTTIGGNTPDGMNLTSRVNPYYRISRVSNVL